MRFRSVFAGAARALWLTAGLSTCDGLHADSASSLDPDAGPKVSDAAPQDGASRLDATSVSPMKVTARDSAADTEGPSDVDAAGNGDGAPDAAYDLGTTARRITAPGLFPSGAHLALWSTSTLQMLFVVAADGATWSAGARDFVYGASSWQPPHRISAIGLFAAGGPLVALQRLPGMIDLFLVSNRDGGFWCGGFLNLSAPTKWGAEYAIGGRGLFDPTTTVAAFSQDSSHTQLVAAGTDGTLWGVSWPRTLGQNAWTDPARLAPDAGVASASSLIATAVPDGNVAVFSIDAHGTLQDPARFDVDAGGWVAGHEPQPTPGLPPNAPVTSLVRAPGLVDLYATSLAGATWNAGTQTFGKPWLPGYSMSANGLFPAGAFVAAVSPTIDATKLFAVGADGALYNAGAWRNTTEGTPWIPASPLTAPGLFPPGAPLVAMAELPNVVDVFVIGVDGALWMSVDTDSPP